MMRRGIKWSVAVGSLAVGLWFYTRPDPITKLKVHGTWEPQFQQVADQFRKNLHSGMMRGGSFAAYVDGKPVVRLWGGYADDEFQLEWKENTLNTVVSFSKLTSAITFNTLVDKGLVNYDDLVSKHWPEFAQNGKEHVTVRELISHQAGLYALDTPISYREVITNPAKVEKILAEQKPAWEPGTAVGYHILTIGLYYDFLTRKIDPKHRPIYQIYEEEIRKPLGLDLYIGTPYAEQYRMARASQPTFRDTLRDFLNNPSFRRVIWSEIFGNKWSKKSLVSVPQVEVDTYFCDPELRALPIPSIGGVATASDAARLFGLVAARKPAIDGKPILSEKAVTALNTVVRTGEELQFKFNVSVGHGTLMWKNPRGENVFGHPAAGGQMGYCDPTNKVGLAFVTNDWGTFATNDDIRFVLLEKAFYNCLGKKK